MKVISIVSRKGGVGKTTLCAHLAVECQRTMPEGVFVGIMDTDPQGSLADWWNSRKADQPVFMSGGLLALESEIKYHKQKSAGFLFIDSEPGQSGAVETIVSWSDFVVIPVRASALDLRAIVSTIDMVKYHKKNFVFVVNAGASNSTIPRQAIDVLSGIGKVSPLIVGNRTDFVRAMVDGRVASELKFSNAASQEIILLWEYIFHELNFSLNKGKFNSLNKEGEKTHV